MSAPARTTTCQRRRAIEEAPLPVRIQRKRTKGWRMPENTVCVTRPGHWGNPFCVGETSNKAMLRKWDWSLKPGHWDGICPTAEEAVRRFRCCIAFDGASAWLAKEELRGKNLACWCAIHRDDEYVPCHADVLLSIANNIPMDEVIRENSRRAKREAVQ